MGQKMGFQGEIFSGVAGNEGGTRLTNSRDINYDIDTEEGETTVRGDGSAPPMVTSDVTGIILGIEFTMVVDDTDTALAALMAAASIGGLVAIRTKDYQAGKGFDGDCHLKVKNGKPLKGEQTKVFTAKPSRRLRAPRAYV